MKMIRKPVRPAPAALSPRESRPHVISLASISTRRTPALPAVRSSKTGKSSVSKPVVTPPTPATPDPLELARLVAQQLDDDKAENILNIPLAGKSPMADAMVVASGRSARHVAALADHVARKLKEAGASKVRVEGLPNADWVLIDAGDIIVHIFRPEVREFYNLERIWASDAPPTTRAATAN